MKHTETKQWKEFRLIGPDGLFADYERGRISVARNLKDGDVPYVGAVFPDKDNGVVRYVTPETHDQITSGNCIAMVCDGAAIGCNMYQEKDFVGTVNLKIVRGSFLNKRTGLFLCAVLNESARRYNYNYFGKRNDEALRNEYIPLPATPDGEPDWDYMDAFMGEVLEKEERFAEELVTLDKDLNGGHVLDTSQWKAFKIGDLFEIERGKSRIMRILSEGHIPLIAAARADQGVAGMYDIKPEYQNAITVSCNGAGCGSVYYHDYEFAITGDASVLIEKRYISKCAKQFIAAICDRLFFEKYSYAEKCNPIGLSEEVVYLPTTPDGEPDWDYMESYMQAQMDKASRLAGHLDRLTA